jgi:hypothetical protein
MDSGSKKEIGMYGHYNGEPAMVAYEMGLEFAEVLRLAIANLIAYRRRDRLLAGEPIPWAFN